MPNNQEFRKLQALAKNEGIHILRAIAEDGQTAIAGVFKESPIPGEGVYLLHIYVRPAFRGRDMIHRFHQHTEQYFSARGADHFLVRCCGNETKLECIYDLLVKEAFVPLIVQGSIMRYRLSDWLESAFMEKAALMEQHLRNVQTIEDWDDPRLQTFLQSGAALPRHCFDPGSCQFYMVDGQIKAALCAERVGEKLLFFYDLIFSENCPRQVAFISLLASFIQKAQRTMPADSELVVQSDLAGIQAGLKAQFGIPEASYLSQEYFYRFGRKKYGSKTPVETSDWHYERVDPSDADAESGAVDTLPLYFGLDEQIIACMKRPSGMASTFLGRTRQRMETEEDIRDWRQELNAWWESIGREPFDADKDLPFDAYLEREIPPQHSTSLPAAGSPETVQIPVQDIRYACITQDMDVFPRILPAHLHRRSAPDERIILAGYSPDGTVLSCGVFSLQDSPPKTIFLEYIYVAPEQRRMGLGSALLAHARELFAGIGLRGITTKQAADPQTTERNHLFFKSAGFQPVSLSTTVVAYYLQSLYHTAIMSMTEAQKAQMPAAEQIPNRGDPRLKQMVYHSRKQGVPLDGRHIDLQFSRFHIKDGVIRAALLMERTAEHVLACRDLWFSPGYDTPYIRAALLEAMLSDAKKRMRDDSLLLLQYDQNWNLEKVDALLGQGEAYQQLCEYVMPIQL